MSRLLDHLSNFPAPLIYLIVGILAFTEAGVMAGIVLPGETAVLLGGYLAYKKTISLPILLIIVVVGAVGGDACGYLVGRRFGPRIRTSRLGIKIGEERWMSSEQFLVRRGGPAILIGRWVGVLRAMIPVAAGMARMPLRRFIPWTTAGAASWAVVCVLLGYRAHDGIKSIERALGRAGLILLVAVILTLLIAYQLRGRRRHRAS